MEDGIDLLRGFMRNTETVRGERQGNMLVIDCRGCRLTPVPGSDECRRDIEISGAAGRAIREVSSIRRWTSPATDGPARCRACRMSRERVMTAAWAGFPRNSVFEGRKVLKGNHPGRDGCAECVMRTSRALDQMDSGIREVVSDMGERR